jgi:hypothetical protein
MDYIDFENIDKKERNELVKFAYDHYYFELEELFFYECLDSPFKTLSFDDAKIELNKLIIDKIPDATNIKYPNSKKVNILDNINNKFNLETLTCYKLLLCSSVLSFDWFIPYLCLYNFYYDTVKANKNIDIDIFIGIIAKLWENEDDNQFEAFEKLITNKYKKIKLEDI